MIEQTIDPRALRDAFGAFATGVTVVTARAGDGKPVGFTANSFSSVSMDPPMLLVCLARTSRSYAAMTGTDRFAVNILSEHQQDVSNTFARQLEDRFSAVEWADAPNGSPIFPGAAAWFECALSEVIEAGDHVILLGRIAAFVNNGLNGLGYVRGRYFTPRLEAIGTSAAAEPEARIGAVLEQNGAIYLLGEERLSLPGCASVDGDPVKALEDHLRQLSGLSIEIGFIYSVFSTKGGRQHNVIYHALAGSGTPREGRFIGGADLVDATFENTATADVIRRFVLESSIGNFGVYFGDDISRRGHPVTSSLAPPRTAE